MSWVSDFKIQMEAINLDMILSSDLFEANLTRQ